jgi:hypothetical protein
MTWANVDMQMVLIRRWHRCHRAHGEDVLGWLMVDMAQDTRIPKARGPAVDVGENLGEHSETSF